MIAPAEPPITAPKIVPKVLFPAALPIIAPPTAPAVPPIAAPFCDLVALHPIAIIANTGSEKSKFFKNLIFNIFSIRTQFQTLYQLNYYRSKNGQNVLFLIIYKPDNRLTEFIYYYRKNTLFLLRAQFED